MSQARMLIVVRHGQSEHHVRRLTGGWTDTPLTALGHEQAARVATRLRDELSGAIVRLYTSDLQRALQTADHIGTALGVQPVTDARLREHNNGAAAGLSFEQARAQFPDGWNAKMTLDARPFPGAETWREFYVRTAPFIDELEDAGTVHIAVTHGGTIVNLVTRWLMLPLSAMETATFSAYPASIFVLQIDARGTAVAERMNDVSHLAAVEGHAKIGPLLRGG